jgi:hypothetical protein
MRKNNKEEQTQDNYLIFATPDKLYIVEIMTR